jgi:hypothetical protein
MVRSLSPEGQYFDPEPNYLMGLGKVGKFEGLALECLNQVGAEAAELDLIQVQNCLPQVLTPATRFILADHENLLFELQREFGKPIARQMGLLNALKQTEAEYLSFWHLLPKRLTLSPDRKRAMAESTNLPRLQRKLARALKSNDSLIPLWVSPKEKISNFGKMIGRQDLLETGTGLWYWITSNTDSDPSMSELLHLFNLAKTGASFRGGMTSYREVLLNMAKRLGVHVPAKTECRRIFIERGRFAGVQITSRGSMISAGGGILGCSLNRAYSKATYTGRNWFHQGKKPPTPLGWKFTLALTVHKEAIPPGMLSRVVWKEKDAPVLELEVVNPADYQMPDGDNRVLYIRTVMPYTLESLKIQFQRLLSARMLRQATEILPFLEFHMTRLYPDFRLVKEAEAGNQAEIRMDLPSNELSEIYQFASLEEIPDNLLVYGGKGLGSTTGVDGLFIASEESYPSLGSFGGVVAALESTAWLAHRTGMAGPFT